MGGIVNAFAIESRGMTDESEEGGNAEPRERRTRRCWEWNVRRNFGVDRRGQIEERSEWCSQRREG